MKAYKGFNSDMTCLGYQYKENGEYATDEAVLCHRGFHACEYSLDCLIHYEPSQSVYHEVELDGKMLKSDDENDTKVAATRIKIGARLSIAGGFPCQDISCAGKGAGIRGERSGLWAEYARIIREIRPRFVFVENSPFLVSRGLGDVLADMAALGYDGAWGVLSAAAVGARHRRYRFWGTFRRED